MSDFPLWNCEFFQLPGGQGAGLESLTVGAPFGLKCHGDLSVSWQAGQPVGLQFAKPEDRYTLSILKVVRQDPNDVQFEVTGYKAGAHNPEFIRFVQGQDGAVKGFESDKPKWTIQSVLDPKAQQPQPIPPFGPFRFGLPLWLTILAVVIFLALAYGLFRFIRRFRQRRKLREEMNRHKTALPPAHQFYRDARLIHRRMQTQTEDEQIKAMVGDLDHEFRLFILRQFEIPALQWSDREIAADLRRRQRKLYNLAGESTRRTLRELSKLKARTKVEFQDLEQVYKMALDSVERLQQAGVK